ncbi:NADH:flavin oxidoreductase [Streptomyces tubercidicus]|uniref:NADH:flavin oxidoreductase n=1 Tax=Streptomyces tubercidicus TaxID=47759 RepID=UPI0036A51C5D
MPSSHPALTPTQLGSLKLANRVAVAPMSRVSTAGDGVPTAEMADYYARFAQGGFALIITEGIYLDHAHSQSYPNQPALVTGAQVAGWRQVVDSVHAAGGLIIAQLMHGGALSQHNHHRRGTIAPSAVPPLGEKMAAYGGSGAWALPRAAGSEDIAEALTGFAEAAGRAKEAGFDGVELHGANGYLIDQFLTTYTNTRTDSYGGDAVGRSRFMAEALAVVRTAVGTEYPVGIRLSQTKVNDLEYRWPGGAAEAEVIFQAAASAGADFLHLASEGRDWQQTATLDTGVTATALARETTGLPVIANGGMHDVVQARTVLDEGHADVIALGRGALGDRDWPQRVADGQTPSGFVPELLQPDVTLGAECTYRARAGETTP